MSTQPPYPQDTALCGGHVPSSQHSLIRAHGKDRAGLGRSAASSSRLSGDRRGLCLSPGQPPVLPSPTPTPTPYTQGLPAGWGSPVSPSPTHSPCPQTAGATVHQRGPRGLRGPSQVERVTWFDTLRGDMRSRVETPRQEGADRPSRY